MTTSSLTARSSRRMIPTHVREFHTASARQNAALGEAIYSAIIVETIRRKHVQPFIQLSDPLPIMSRIDANVRDEDIIDLTEGDGYWITPPPAYIAADAMGRHPSKGAR